MKRTPIPHMPPVAIALESLNLSKRSNAFKATGIDLESGRRVAVKFDFAGDWPQPLAPTVLASHLVLTLTIERIICTE